MLKIKGVKSLKMTLHCWSKVFSLYTNINNEIMS
jgi:hypothetical protein